MHRILDRPVRADRRAKDGRIIGDTRQEIADLALDLVCAIDAADGLDGQHGAQPRPPLRASRAAASVLANTRRRTRRPWVSSNASQAASPRAPRAKAMLLEMRYYRRLGERMIGLERQQIIAPARQDPLGNRALASHGVQGHDAVRQDQLVQQCRDGGDLVGLASTQRWPSTRPCALAQALTTCSGRARACGRTSGGASCRRWRPPRARSRPPARRPRP